MPDATVDVRLIVPFSNMGLLEEAVIVGTGYTVTTPLAVAAQPAALVAVTVYVPAVVVEMLVVVAPVLHRYEVPPVAVRVMLVPLQADGLLTAGVGLAAAVTVPLAVAVQPAALVTVTVYVPREPVVMLAVVAPVLHT